MRRLLRLIEDLLRLPLRLLLDEPPPQPPLDELRLRRREE